LNPLIFEQVFFATCFDADEFENLGRYIGKAVDCEVEPLNP